MHESAETTTLRRALVWDLPTRLFHWLLAGAIVGAYWTGEFGGFDKTWHMRFGYAVLALVVFRILWGLFGSRTARFASFLRGPGTVWAYLRTFGSRHAHPTDTHNPMGALSVIALLLAVLAQAGSGLFADDDILTQGPLNGLISSGVDSLASRTHGLAVWFIIALVVLHLAAIAYYRFRKGENLTAAMVTGYKQLPAGMGMERPASLWLAGLFAAISTGCVYFTVEILPPLLR
ncbi:cytochrome b/b6 domain-containing protein [Oceanibaculum nanhaiense]|uniref:cytochrome b/b6 domain-containing protein n=1 Tax=Oceanibaculum nanhaiense TaxID=1909734 RepID=UPI00396ECC29